MHTSFVFKLLSPLTFLTTFIHSFYKKSNLSYSLL
jgi:hypothetical protein